MIRLYAFDVAISFAEEDMWVAEQIAMALKERGVRYYYYKEWKAKSWGEDIIKFTIRSYGRHTRFVLMITSKHFVVKYWSGIEQQIALASKTRILQLRLDDTQVNGISKYVVHLEWDNNPIEIADLLQQKIRMHKIVERRLVRCFLVGLVMALSIFLIYIFSSIDPPFISLQQKIILVDGPSHSFCISNTEVTIAQYRKFCEEQKMTLPPQLPSAYEDGPVVNVTWYEALAYCKWKNGRLPTEEEWEYAAGAGLPTKYSGGNNAKKVAVCNLKKPGRVRSKASNAFGVYDMTGNVAEWCVDSSAEWRAVRGGAYNSKINPVNELAIAYRTKELPDARKPYIGFRVAWDANNKP